MAVEVFVFGVVGLSYLYHLVDASIQLLGGLHADLVLPRSHYIGNHYDARIGDEVLVAASEKGNGTFLRDVISEGAKGPVSRPNIIKN